MRSVNKNLQPRAARLLEYLWENSGRKMLLGQHTQTVAQEELTYIKNVTGDLPALCGFELLGYSPNIRYETAGEDCLKEVREAQHTLKRAWQWAKSGGILTFSWHWFSPMGGKDKSFYTRNTDFDPSRALIAGTAEHSALVSDMDYMAGILAAFCDAGIPILWRPFHECEGDWFWWGSKGGKTAAELFRLMFERYTEHFHLDNLIWVFNSPAAECYPGDDVVDVLTRDMYPPAHCHTACMPEMEQLRAITSSKLYAIGETGTIPDVRQAMESSLPWSWYMTWSKEFVTDSYTSQEFLRQTYEYENSITLSRLPDFLKP